MYCSLNHRNVIELFGVPHLVGFFFIKTCMCRSELLKLSNFDKRFVFIALSQIKDMETITRC